MTAPNRTAIILTGIIVGAVALAAVLGFSVVLPRLEKADDIALPTSLSGGLTAVDRGKFTAQGATEQQIQQVATEARTSSAYAHQQYKDKLDVDAATRTYTNKDFTRYIQVFAARGDAQFPLASGMAPINPDNPQATGQKLQVFGDATCTVTSQLDQSGKEIPTVAECVRSSNGTTVSIIASLYRDKQLMTVKQAVGVLDEIWSKVA